MLLEIVIYENKFSGLVRVGGRLIPGAEWGGRP